MSRGASADKRMQSGPFCSHSITAIPSRECHGGNPVACARGGAAIPVAVAKSQSVGRAAHRVQNSSPRIRSLDQGRSILQNSESPSRFASCAASVVSPGTWTSASQSTTATVWRRVISCWGWWRPSAPSTPRRRGSSKPRWKRQKHVATKRSPGTREYTSGWPREK